MKSEINSEMFEIVIKYRCNEELGLRFWADTVNNMKSFSMHQTKHLETVTCKFSEPNDKSQHSINSYEIKPLKVIL